ncbi:glycosyltransferase [Microcoleus sp. F10-C6]|uniref:glycosyltransferase n=1 Tax=unclassified Microcoleus TaxID=2642155 RepID=UPI002FD35080
MINTKPSVSIGMPVYNGESYIRQALNSLLAQDYPNFELIISDNASTDQTQEICQEYAANYPQIRYFRNAENLGSSKNFNRVFELAIGEYFMWAAHDDLWHPSYISKCVAKLQEHPQAVMCCSEVAFIDEEGNINPDWNHYRNRETLGMEVGERVFTLVNKLTWIEVYSLIRSSALKQTNKVSSSYGADVILELELFILGETVKIPEVLFSYRIPRKVAKTSYDLMVSLNPDGADKQRRDYHLSLAKDLLKVLHNSGLDERLKKSICTDYIATVCESQEWLEMIAREQLLPFQNPAVIQQVRLFVRNQLQEQFGRSNLMTTSRLCIYRDFLTDYYRHWIAQMKEEFTPRRKQWEFVAIVQALHERGLLGSGKKGLGFAVGNEPLPSLFASFGCEIVATDQGLNPVSQKQWGETDQLCKGKEALNEKGICPPEQFERLVEFREVDMNFIPEDLRLGKFDFIWSSCAFEHIGSIEKGLKFVQNSMDCLKSGGVAFHTTEFNCTSNAGTLDLPNLVFYRLQDIDRLIKELEKQGHWVEPISYEIGSDEPDLKVARAPYTEPHLKLEMGGYVATSLLLIVRKDYYKKGGISSLPVVSQEREKPIKIIYDISVLGYGQHTYSSRTGVARVIENIALGLLASKEIDLSFCGSHSMYAVYSCLDYLQSQPIFKETPFVHPSFIYILIKKLNDLYGMLEKRGTIAPESGADLKYQPLMETLKISLSNSLSLTGNYSNLLDADSLSRTDIFHTTFYHFPEAVKQIKNLKKFATVYDLIPIVLSDLYVGKNDSDYQRMIKSLESITAEDYVLCISQATKNDLLDRVKAIDPAKVFVTYLAANPNTFYQCTDTDKLTAVRNKYSIPDAQYILAVSTLEPRKNLEHVIRCFAQLVQQQGIKDLYLVLVGAFGWDYEPIFEEISKGGLSKDRILITGYVADEDLAALYSGALVFVYPSLYEGFGLPPLEAMQCGVPVITSNNSSLPEVVGSAGIMLHPQDADGLCHEMLQLYKSQSLRQQMSRKSLEQAKTFSWERCIQETTDAYKIALSS